VKYSGSCLCGQVVFEITGKFEVFYLCHCQHCQKDTGSAHAANIFSESAKLTWLSGEDKVTNFDLPASRHVRSFCSQCGSALPNLQENGTLLVVPAGSLDGDVPISPRGHIFMASKANWDDHLENLPKFERSPS